MLDKYNSPFWQSSYEANNYAEFFYSIIRLYYPEKVVELGTKTGFSAYHIAHALFANGKGSLDCYDLWEDYKFNPVPKATAEKNVKEFKDIVTFTLGNVIGVERNYKTVDILHVDVHNNGEILEKIIPFWIDKVVQCIIIEGGSKERDNVSWMKQFGKIPIAKWLKDFKSKRPDIEYFTIEPFPSVTIMRKI